MQVRRGRGGIRPPRKLLATRDDVDPETTWAVLEKAFLEIHARDSSNLSFEELFRSAYRLVLKKHGDFLFEKVKQVEINHLDNNIRTHIRSMAVPSLLLSNANEAVSLERAHAGDRFVRDLTLAFKQHSIEAGMITDVLMYMERVAATEAKKTSIYTVSLGLFRERVLQAQASASLEMSILELLEMIMLEMIARERAGEIIDRPLLKAACRMLENLYETLDEQETARLYLTSFEPKFLQASRDHYSTEGQSLLETADATTFCARAKQRLKEEKERCQQSLSLVTDPKIETVVEDELIMKHIAQVIDMPGTGVKNMLDNDRIGDLHNMYQLVKRVSKDLQALKNTVHARVMELGREINAAASQIAADHPSKAKQDHPAADDGKTSGKTKERTPPARQLNQQTLAAINWVEEVLKLKRKYDNILQQAFESDPIMEKFLEVSFQDFINENKASPEYLSLFLDQYLKSSGKDKSEAEVDSLLDHGVTLVQYLADKDVLETYYHKHMAKRLLTGKSISRDIERQMLGKMKLRLGNQFTTKMEKLLSDAVLSESLAKEYKAHIDRLGDGANTKIELEPSILTLNAWPISIPDPNARSCVLPPEVARVRESFEKFYHSKHTGRKLTWLPHMGDVTMRATYKKGGKPITYEISGPTYFMVILMLFNDHDRLSFDELLQITNIPADKLTQTLLSIAVAPKTRLLIKEPMSREIKPTDVFSYNDKFEHQFRKFKVAVVSDAANKVETSEQRRDTKKKADDERGLSIDAAVVRIMKARKTLTHQQLMTETIDILKTRFVPDVSMIKRKIESLIEREYLERGPDSALPSYNYLA